MVEEVKNLKFLGVTLTNQLTWTNNTSQLVRKAQQRLFIPEETEVGQTATKATQLLSKSCGLHYPSHPKIENIYTYCPIYDNCILFIYYFFIYSLSLHNLLHWHFAPNTLGFTCCYIIFCSSYMLDFFSPVICCTFSDRNGVSLYIFVQWQERLIHSWMFYHLLLNTNSHVWIWSRTINKNNVFFFSHIVFQMCGPWMSSSSSFES